jgi:hypothetical protein
MYYLQDEQEDCWWPQFRDIVSARQHEQKHEGKRMNVKTQENKTAFQVGETGMLVT